MKKFDDKKHHNKDTELNNKIHQNWDKRMDSPMKKMSKGAANIFRMIKTRWGNGFSSKD